MRLEEEAENEFMGAGGRTWKYEERDIPANQIAQNLEMLIKERMKKWDYSTFEEKLEIEMNISSYLKTMMHCFKGIGIELPDVKDSQVSELKRLDRMYHRSVLEETIKFTKILIDKLEWAKKNSKMIWQAYHYLIENDCRVSPTTRDELLASLRPEAQNQAMAMIKNAGGIEGPETGTYLIKKQQELGEPIDQLVKTRIEENKYNTSLVRVDRNTIVGYIKNYYMLDVLFRAIRKRSEMEQKELTDLENNLRKYGGPLTPSERQKITGFEQGWDPDRNLGRYTAYLDYIRIVGEFFMHGGPQKMNFK